MIILREYDIELDENNVKKLLSSNGGRGLEDIIEGMMRECSQTARPILVYDTFEVEVIDDERLLIGDVNFQSNFLRRCIGHKDSVHPFVMTLGRKTDEALYSKSNVLEQYILDSLYNLKLIRMERKLRKEIGKEHGYKNTSKLSPGSLDFWPLQQQLPLFDLLSDGINEIDVELDDNCIMHPSKSLSGIIFPTNMPFSSCIFCSMEGCPGREQPYQIEKMEYYLARI